MPRRAARWMSETRGGGRAPQPAARRPGGAAGARPAGPEGYRSGKPVTQFEPFRDRPHFTGKFRWTHFLEAAGRIGFLVYMDAPFGRRRGKWGPGPRISLWVDWFISGIGSVHSGSCGFHLQRCLPRASGLVRCAGWDVSTYRCPHIALRPAAPPPPLSPPPPPSPPPLPPGADRVWSVHFGFTLTSRVFFYLHRG